jgi:hypothetical protein
MRAGASSRISQSDRRLCRLRRAGPTDPALQDQSGRVRQVTTTAGVRPNRASPIPVAIVSASSSLSSRGLCLITAESCTNSRGSGVEQWPAQALAEKSSEYRELAKLGDVDVPTVVLNPDYSQLDGYVRARVEGDGVRNLTSAGQTRRAIAMPSASASGCSCTIRSGSDSGKPARRSTRRRTCTSDRRSRDRCS